MPAERRSPRIGSSPGAKPGDLVGLVVLERVGRWRFPVYQLSSGGEVVARLGRAGWWRIFLGRGQRIELPDGTHWRLRAIGTAGAICPVIVDSEVRKVALASPHHGGYGVNGPDWAYVLYPAEQRRFVRANRWVLRQHEENVAEVTRTPKMLDATSPVPLGVVLLALALVTHSIPGEAKLGIPAFRWGAP